MASQIVLFASEVSVICEFNPYRNIHDTFMDVWKRTAPAQILTVEKAINLKMKSKEQQIEKLIQAIDTEGKISNLVKAASSSRSIYDVKKSVQRAEAIIPAIIPKIPAEKPKGDSKKDPRNERIQELVASIGTINIEQEIIKSVESKMNKGFGTNQEAVAIKRYEEKHKSSIKQRNEKFHKRVVANIDGCLVVVGGKVDGVKEDGTIVEVKNRMRRFFDPLPEYDIAQLQTYMFILNASKGELVEQLKGSSSDIKNTIIDRDDQMWENVMKPRIVRFCSTLQQFMKDSDLQHKFILGNDYERKCLVDELM